ncbi:PQ loop repeat-domain-containing protein, partial [Circinella umbellata]
SIAMVFGPIVGYVDQYFIIRRKQSSAGFSSVTCGVLLIANILRIFFWLGKRFDETLLAQSVAMILSQLVLLEIVVRFRHDPSPLTLYNDGLTGHERSRPRRFLSSIWSWGHYLDYVNFLLGFTTFIAVLYLLLGGYSTFVETLGFLSLGIESTLPVPQCLSNFRRKSTHGFSLLVLGSWFFGDSFKLFYFIHTQSPLQFIVCGAIQLSVDCLIVAQFVLFSERVKK